MIEITATSHDVERLQILADAASALHAAEDPGEVIESICERVSSHLGLEVFVVHLLETDGETLRVYYSKGVSESASWPKGWVMCPCEKPCCPAVVVDKAHHPECFGLTLLHMNGVKAFTCHPMSSRGRLMGRLLFGARHRDLITQEDMTLVQTVGDHLATALDRARLLEQLRRQAEDLRQADRIKDNFLATVTHELRTPLVSILGWVQRLRSGKLGDEKAAYALDVIERNSRAQAQLIDDLLDVSRIVAGKLRLELAPVNLASIIGDALDVIRPVADAKGVELAAFLPPLSRGLNGDPDRLEQVVWNLLSNAVKFTPSGGRVEARLDETGDAARIVVTDSGIGISEKFLPCVFDAFCQEDKSASRAAQGLGLGLTIVRHLVELHGGAIKAECEGPGQGTKFTVVLPFVPAQRAG